MWQAIRNPQVWAILPVLVAGCVPQQIASKDNPAGTHAHMPADQSRFLEAKKGTVVVSDAAPEGWGNDHYQLNGGWLSDGFLVLELSYGGGCKPHDFTLVVPRALGNPPPAQLEVSLSHDANGDRCEAWLTNAYRFDLTIIGQHFEDTFGGWYGSVALGLGGLPADSLIYDFEARATETGNKPGGSKKSGIQVPSVE